MTSPTPSSRDAYYREAATWSRDRADDLRRSRRVAWIAASVVAVIAVAEAGALIALTPLKTVQPYTLLVDRQTGYVQALDPLRPAQVSADTALTQSFVVQYVIARESYDAATVQADYRKVASWSEGSARSAYIAAMQASNPDSPVAALPRSSVVETRVKSVSPADRNTLLVRFDTVRRDAGGQVRPGRPWIALVRFRYTGEPLRLEDRLLNPLGFAVSYYRRSAEALVPDVAPAPVAVVAPVTGTAIPVRAVQADPAGAPAAAVPPSPLRSVRQPSYVAPPVAGRGTATPLPPGIVGYNRRGQPIVGGTP